MTKIFTVGNEEEKRFEWFRSFDFFFIGYGLCSVSFSFSFFFLGQIITLTAIIRRSRMELPYCHIAILSYCRSVGQWKCFLLHHLTCSYGTFTIAGERSTAAGTASAAFVKLHNIFKNCFFGKRTLKNDGKLTSHRR